MADVTTTNAVLELAKLSRQLDEAGWKLREAERKAVNSEHVYRVEKAKALLAAEGTVSERDAQALLQVAEQRIAAKLAEADLRIIRNDIRILEDRLDVGRSIVGVLRAEAAVAR